MAKENRLADMSMNFAVEALHFCEMIHGHYSLVDQLERSATGVGANIREAQYAHSRADFISKLQIALKVCSESEYWLELFVKAGYVSEDTVAQLFTLCKQTRYLLIASINTAKNGSKNEHLDG